MYTCRESRVARVFLGSDSLVVVVVVVFVVVVVLCSPETGHRRRRAGPVNLSLARMGT
jgi:hypothetical protein